VYLPHLLLAFADLQVYIYRRLTEYASIRGLSEKIKTHDTCRITEPRALV